MRIVLLDNYDSFTHNLLHLLQIAQPSATIDIFRNNDKTILNQNYDVLVAGPGPGTPAETGILKTLYENIIVTQKPYLGVCLGMQFLAWVHNARVVRSAKQIHGDTCFLYHNNSNLFENIPQNSKIARYNSLAVIPSELDKTPFSAIATDLETGETMAMQHNSLPIFGIQFHPESFLTEFGLEIVQNFFQQYTPQK